MGKFNWRRKRAGRAREDSSIKEDESMDISTLPSPNLNTTTSYDAYSRIDSEPDTNTIPRSSEDLHSSHKQRPDDPNLGIGIGPSSSAPESPYLDSPWTSSSSDTATFPRSPPPNDAAEWASWTFDQEMRKSFQENHEKAVSPLVESSDSDDDDPPQESKPAETEAVPGCSAHHVNYTHGWSIPYILILTGSMFASIFSMIWLVLAFVKLNWAWAIGSRGMSLSTATFVISMFAKVIEGCSLTTFAGFLGQIFSRNAIKLNSAGISLAVLNVRLWMTRPGLILTNFGSALCAFKKRPIVAFLALLTTIAGLLYTPASNALVSPKLAFGPSELRTLYGPVQASYANPVYIESSCQTPITTEQDPDYAGATCVSMEHVGQAYQNYLGFTQTWAFNNAQGETTNDITTRPPPTAQLYGNTSIVGTWIYTDDSNMASLYAQHDQRIINNITVAMPHPGVLSAARHQKNGISQPADFGGTGEYTIKAAVPSPALNVLCANLDQKELAPLVYTQWPHAKTVATDIPGWINPKSPFWTDDVPRYSDNEWLNRTKVDDIFGWGEKYGRRPPIFGVLPIDYNTVINESIYYGDSTYILLKSHDTTNYTVCSMRSFLYPNCSTEYSVSGTLSGLLQTSCDDPDSEIEYRNVVPDAPITISNDFPNVASEWALAVSLNDGSLAGNASNPRMLTQMIPTVPQLDGFLPSVAEAIAVLAGCTLLLSMTAAPFVHYWGYSNGTILNETVFEPFTATVVTSQYKSTFTEPWEACLFFSLFWTCLASLYVTYYFLTHRRLVTDYTETENVYALGVNSPPSDTFSGACGRGPSGAMMSAPIWVAREENSNHYYFTEAPQRPEDEAEGDDDMEMVILKRMSTMKSKIASRYSSVSLSNARPKEEEAFV